MKIIIMLILFSSSLFGREPAIEPTFGLSIEEMAMISPQDARGFNFTKTLIINEWLVLVTLLIVTFTILIFTRKKKIRRL